MAKMRADVPAASKKGAHRDTGSPNPSGEGRREEIIRVAAELFAELGYKATTIRMIAAEAGILSGSLYYHFTSKEDIADALLSQYFAALVAAYEEVIATSRGSHEALRRMVAVAFESIEQHRAAILLIQNDMTQLAQHPRFEYVTSSVDRIEALWQSIVEDGVRNGDFREGLSVSTTFRFVRGAIWSVPRWFSAEGRYSAGQLADDFSTMILDGVGAPPTPRR